MASDSDVPQPSRPEGQGSILRLRSNDLVWHEVEGEVVALDLRASLYLALNSTGTALWSALTTGATRGELVELLMQRFGVDQERSVADTEKFLAKLAGHDLLEA